MQRKLAINLGIPFAGKIGKISKWSFEKLPKENIEIIYKPEINNVSKILISIGPFRLMLILGIIVFIIHILIVIWFRKIIKTKKYSIVVIIGSIILPFLILSSYIDFFDLIDNLIGKNAGRHHGYTFFVMLLYPILTPIYWIMVRGVDKIFQS